MISFILWYISISLLGLLTFPLAYRLLPALADRGYALTRTFGLLLWGFIFWLLASLGILPNNHGGLLFALGGLGILSLWALRGLGRDQLQTWWQARRSQVIAVEVLFLVAFAGWAFVRSANPEIAGTEKPMELAFINAILYSPEFPPHDPWLAGYAISYYYFGYVMVAMLAKLTFTSGPVAFNLGVALIFALSAVGAYGILDDLLSARQFQRAGRVETPVRTPARRTMANSPLPALLGPLFLLIVSNLEGFLHSLHNRGLFGMLVNGEWVAPFWKWLDMKELSLPPEPPLTWAPTRFWWWWRASRVVQDYDLAGGWKEVIDEFPFFSYLLGDLHPHVLAMPFALLAIGLALNLFLGGGRGRLRLLTQQLHLSWTAFALAVVVLGGLAFLNTWDFPIYVALFCGAYSLYRLREKEWEVEGEEKRGGTIPTGQLLIEFTLLGAALGVGGVILYLPFYLGFSSQAGGLLPNLVYVTRGAHLWVMFGVLLLPLLAFLLYRWKAQWDGERFMKGLLLALGLTFVLWLLALLFGWAITRLPVLGDVFLDSIGALGKKSELFREAFIRRFTSPGGWVTLVGVLGLALGLLWSKGRSAQAETEPTEPDQPVHAPDDHYFLDPFVLLLILGGGLLVLAPEFFFLRDQFGTRMNTIFKLYYQAWILWSLAAAFGTVVLWKNLRGVWGIVYSVGISALILAALVYPIFSLWNKTDHFSPSEGQTLDGGAFFARSAPDDFAAITWLQTAPPGVVAEAVGGSYSPEGHARVSMYSGQPTVLGWVGHESQWRGGGKEMGSRMADIERLYRTNNWEETLAILQQYNIQYVFVGGLERSAYRVNEIKFERFLTPVFQQGQATIYAVPADLLETQAAVGGKNSSP